MSTPETAAKVQQLIDGSPVVIFSKTYCPFCKATEGLFATLSPDEKVKTVYLDKMDDGSDLQDSLAALTGQRTVPNVFIAGKHIGGNDNVQATHRGNQLVPMLQKAGAALA